MSIEQRFTRRKAAAVVVAVALAVSLGPLSGPEARPGGEGSIPPDVYAKALDAPGRVVRRGADTKVTRVVVRDEDERIVLYRVRVKGDFPPRALRYEVLAGDSLVGYGIPTPSQKAIRTITLDRAVTSATIDVDYEGGRSGSAGGTRTLPRATGAVPGDMPDPSDPGPYEVTAAVYDLGDEVFQPTDIGAKIELTGSVHYPTGLPDGPYPVALFLHGNHVTCYKGERRTRFEWPCREGFSPIPNYAGYDYIGKRLASHGFIVVSVSANGVNALGDRVSDTGMRQRGELLEKHLDLWSEWSTVGGGPFGDTFVGKVDLTRIGTMGHSRGGEGVVWHRTVDEERADPYGIDAVLALAPVDFTRTTINNVTFATMLPTCDGDVSDLQGVHFFDDSRYSVPGDPTPKHTITVFGANHNFFNKVWSPSSPYPGGSDDGDFASCGERLAERPQRQIGRAYIVGYLRRYVQNDLSIDPMWIGESVPTTLDPMSTLVSYHAPDTPTHRRDLLRFTSPHDLTENHLGGDVRPEGLARYAWCADTETAPCLPDRFSFNEIHLPGLSQGILGWSDHAARLSLDLPVGTGDVSGFDAFQFRAAMPPGYQANSGVRYQDLAIALIDGSGNTSEVVASEVGNEALRQQLSERRRARGHVILNQVRFPLEDFTGVDLTDITTVEFRFSRMLEGVIDVADVAFSSGGVVIP
ncbi:MAG: hypothetical protein ACRDLB_10155 [Actinomycetota bacterium]